MTIKIYFDEAGNTGPDLMNTDQPVYVLAANIYNENEARALLGDFKLQNGEAKFKNLKRSNSGQKKITDFIRKVVENPGKVKIQAIHKKFMLLSSILNYVVEPLYYEHGLNYTANKQHIGIANFMWYGIQLSYGVDTFNRFLASFIELIKNRNSENKDLFYEKINSMRSDISNGYRGRMFDDLLLAQGSILDSLKTINICDFDPVQTGLFTHAGFWANYLNENFEIIHDESNSLKQSLENFYKFNDHSKVPKEINFNGRIIKLPLKVNSVSLEESKAIPQIQVSDLIAGSIAHILRVRASNVKIENMDSFSQSLWDSGIIKLLENIVWPEEKFTPKDFGITQLESKHSTNAIDQITDFLYFGK